MKVPTNIEISGCISCLVYVCMFLFYGAQNSLKKTCRNTDNDGIPKKLVLVVYRFSRQVLQICGQVFH